MSTDNTQPNEDGDEGESDLTIRKPPKVLVPVEVLEGETVPTALVEFLAPSEIVLLGYHVLPEQTPTEQAHTQFEDRAQDALDDIAQTFRDAGREVETRLVFTHDRDQTIERVATDTESTAILLPNPTGEVEEVFVPLRGAINVARMADLVGTLFEGREATVTLFHVAESMEEAEQAESMIADARTHLVDRGVAEDAIHDETAVTDTPIRTIAERAPEYDVTVMGEGGESLFTRLLGEPSERIAEESVGPVLVVRAGGE